MSTSIKNIKVSIQQGKQSLTAVVQAFLDKTAKSKTNSFVETFNEEALAAAIKIEAKYFFILNHSLYFQILFSLYQLMISGISLNIFFLIL